MNLNLMAFSALDNRVTRSFLWPVLGTHVRLSCLNGPVRASIILRDLDSLVPILGASFSATSAVNASIPIYSTCLIDHWRTHADLWSAADDRARCSESLRCTCHRRVDQLFFDDCRLITRSDVLYFLNTLATTWVAAQVSDLPGPNVSSGLAATFKVIKYDIFDFMQLIIPCIGRCCRTTSSPLTQIGRFSKRVLLHEESIVSDTRCHGCPITTSQVDRMTQL